MTTRMAPCSVTDGDTPCPGVNPLGGDAETKPGGIGGKSLAATVSSAAAERQRRDSQTEDKRIGAEIEELQTAHITTSAR